MENVNQSNGSKHKSKKHSKSSGKHRHDEDEEELPKVIRQTVSVKDLEGCDKMVLVIEGLRKRAGEKESKRSKKRKNESSDSSSSSSSDSSDDDSSDSESDSDKKKKKSKKQKRTRKVDPNACPKKWKSAFKYFEEMKAKELIDHDEALSMYRKMDDDAKSEWIKRFEEANSARDEEIKVWRDANPEGAAKIDKNNERLRQMAKEKKAKNDAEKAAENGVTNGHVEVN